MNTSEKIKYYRTQLGITQDKLAELTGIHPVSIRKYETNKMQPQPAQLERIAAALGVSYNALNGAAHAGMRLETVGDLMGVLMVLTNSGILEITGERGSDRMLNEDTVSISFNSALSSYLALEEKGSKRSLEEVLLHVKSHRIFKDLLIWEKMNFLYTSAIQSAKDHPSEAAQAVVNEIENDKEMVELELQKSQVMRDTIR